MAIACLAEVVSQCDENQRIKADLQYKPTSLATTEQSWVDSTTGGNCHSLAKNTVKLFDFSQILHRQKHFFVNEQPRFTLRAPVTAPRKRAEVLSKNHAHNWTTRQLYTQLLIWNLSTKIDKLKSLSLDKVSTRELLLMRILEKFRSTLTDSFHLIDFHHNLDLQLRPMLKNPANEIIRGELVRLQQQRESIRLNMQEGVRMLKHCEQNYQVKSTAKISVRSIKKNYKELDARVRSIDEQFRVFLVLLTRVDSRTIQNLSIILDNTFHTKKQR